jgi:hypothetical protein
MVSRGRQSRWPNPSESHHETTARADIESPGTLIGTSFVRNAHDPLGIRKRHGFAQGLPSRRRETAGADLRLRARRPTVALCPKLRDRQLRAQVHRYIRRGRRAVPAACDAGTCLPGFRRLRQRRRDGNSFRRGHVAIELCWPSYSRIILPGRQSAALRTPKTGSPFRVFGPQEPVG